LDEVIHNYIVDLDFYFTPPCWLNPIQHPQVEGPLYAPGCKEHTKEIGWEELPYGHTMFFLTLMLEGDEKFSDCS
jgi:hypothetical protein